PRRPGLDPAAAGSPRLSGRGRRDLPTGQPPPAPALRDRLRPSPRPPSGPGTTPPPVRRRRPGLRRPGVRRTSPDPRRRGPRAPRPPGRAHAGGGRAAGGLAPADRLPRRLGAVRPPLARRNAAPRGPLRRRAGIRLADTLRQPRRGDRDHLGP